MREAPVGVGRGKLILCGEHAVVYGHPAIAVATDRRTRVRLTPGAPSFGDGRLADAVALAIPTGWTATVETDLPIGAGMGSSAALTVALLRAGAAARGEELGFEALYERGFAIERLFHGNPSGLDHATAASEGALLYRRGPPPSFAPLARPAGALVVLDSGSVASTAELVAGVAARRPGIDPLLARIGALVGEAVGALDDPRALGALLDEDHALLRQIGVSTPALDALVALARAAGAQGAKLSGAGGGGIVIALATDPAPVLAAAARAGARAFTA